MTASISSAIGENAVMWRLKMLSSPSENMSLFFSSGNSMNTFRAGSRITPKGSSPFPTQHLSKERYPAIGPGQRLRRPVGDCALRLPGHDVLGVDVLEQIVSVLVFDRRLVNRTALEQMPRDLDVVRRDVRVVPEVQRPRVVDRDTRLESVLPPQSSAAPDGEDVRKDDGMTDTPIVGILRLPLHQATLDDSEFELVECDLGVMPADRDLHAVLFL